MFYQCQYCDAIFKSDVRFLKHSCREMKRVEESKTVIGQIAYTFYEQWIKQQRGKTSTLESFLISRFYNSFIKFAHFIKRIKGLAAPDVFMKLMIQNKFPPSMWCDNKVYVYYIKYMESQTSTSEKVTITLQTLEKIADQRDVELHEVFSCMCVDEIVQLMFVQKLSPWVLLASKKFINYIVSLGEEEQLILEDTINVKVWKQTFDANPKSVKTIKTCLKQLKL